MVFAQGDKAQNQTKPDGLTRCGGNHLRVPGQPPEECGQGQHQGTVRQQQDTTAQQKQRTETAQEGTQQGGPLAEPAFRRLGQQGERDGVAQQGWHPQGKHRSPQPLAGPGPEPNRRGMVEIAEGRMLAVERVIGLVVSRWQDHGKDQPQDQPGEENQWQQEPGWEPP